MENQAKANANLAAVKKRILAEIAAIQTDAKGVFSAQTWADFGALGSRLAKAGVAWKTCGVSGNFTSFMEKAFCDEAERGVIELRLNKAGKSPNSRVRLKKAPSPAAAKKTSTSANAVSPSQPKKPSTSANSQPKKLSDAELKKRVFEAIRKEQTDKAGVCDPTKWVYFTSLCSRLRQEGVDCKKFGCASYAKLLEPRFAGSLQFDKSKSTAWRVRPKTKETGTRQASVPKPAGVSSPSQPKKLSDAELKKRVLAELAALQTNENGDRDASVWVRFANLGSRVKKAGVDFKAFGCSTFAKLITERFAAELEFERDPNDWRARPKKAPSVPVPAPVATAPSIPVTVAPSQAATLSDAELKKRVWAALLSLQTDAAGRRDPSAWVDFTVLGPRLKADGVDCKAFGCASYAKLLESRFADSLQFDKSEPTAWRVRPTLTLNKNNALLADWAIVDQEQIGDLGTLVFPEKRSFQNAESTRDSRFPILESYLKYTFRQLAFEGKVQIAKDVAAFNVGLFTRQYDPIFAFFRKNNGCEAQPWRLSSFAVAGENADGKELVMRFRPLPKRARYFDRREDFVFDDEAEIYCDAEHCLVERVYRLPNKFLRRCCSPKFLELEIDGETRTFDEIADKPETDAARLQYFEALAKKLPGSNELVLMKAAFNAAVEQAKKRVAANFRTAVPAFNPMKRKVYFCLPLALGDPASNRPDVALVVQWIAETGVYQGHTIYTLEMAYKNARLTARLGDENWLDGEMGKI